MWLHDQHNSGLPFGSSSSTNPCKGKHDENITLYGSRFFFFFFCSTERNRLVHKMLMARVRVRFLSVLALLSVARGFSPADHDKVLPSHPKSTLNYLI